jgi:hypothetical protein
MQGEICIAVSESSQKRRAVLIPSLEVINWRTPLAFAPGTALAESCCVLSCGKEICSRHG